MRRTQVLRALVLKTYDVGESDRFCILFSREKGILAARARAVRKPLSKMGGSLLPYNLVDATVKETSAGYMIADVVHRERYSFPTLSTLLPVQQGIEVLLSLVHEEEPLSELFDDTTCFLHFARESNLVNVQAYIARSLWLLGLLPTIDHTSFYSEIDPRTRQMVQEIFSDHWHQSLGWQQHTCPALETLCHRIIEHHGQRPLKAAAFCELV